MAPSVDQRLVTGPGATVDPLEAIEVDEQHADPPRAVRERAHGALEAIHQLAAVDRARQLVVMDIARGPEGPDHASVAGAERHPCSRFRTAVEQPELGR